MQSRGKSEYLEQPQDCGCVGTTICRNSDPEDYVVLRYFQRIAPSGDVIQFADAIMLKLRRFH
jgi:hypothetical protein